MPELRDNGDFFNRDVLDFQYSLEPVETPFPTWGSVSSNNLVAMGANAAAAAPTASSNATTHPVKNTPVGTVGAARAPIVAVASSPTGANRHALPESSQVALQPGTVALDRHVFLRQRLGGESVSSGNSSTSTSSDNGSASDDGAAMGEWELVCNADIGVTVVKVEGEVAQGPGGRTTKAPKQAAARKKRQMRSGKSKAGSRKATKREGEGSAGASERATAGSGLTGRAGEYASWAALVRPLKQQWDHVEVPTVATAANSNVIATQCSDKTLNGACCSVFSTEPRPYDPTSFSVEQCSAQAHRTAVASYVLRVRCAGGAHIIRRTWDDLAALCTMLRLHFSLTGASLSDSTGAGGRAAAGGTAAPAAAAAAASAAGVEFAPADVVAVDAASGFLKNLLSRPGMTSATPVRRFLELEFLDGTIRGVVVDGGREKAAREVASMAAGAAASASMAAGLSAPLKPFIVPSDVETATRGEAALSISVTPPEGSLAQVTAGAGGTMASVTGVRLEGATRVFIPGRIAPALPAHPDAARDLAIVCRCLGKLGAAAFMSMPWGVGGVPHWGAKEAAAKAPAASVEGNKARIIASPRGSAVLA